MSVRDRLAGSGSSFLVALVTLSVFTWGLVTLPISSPAGATTVVKSAASGIEIGDGQAAGADPVLLEGRRTAMSDTWLQPDGMLRTEVYTAPINYQTDAGTWEPIDNQLVDSPATGVAVENAAND